MSQRTFSDTLIRLEVLKAYLYFVQKSTFFQGVSPWFLTKNGQFLKSPFFHLFMSLGMSAYRKTPLGIILSANNTLTKNFLFNSHPDFIFCGQFLSPWSLTTPKKCLRGRF